MLSVYPLNFSLMNQQTPAPNGLRTLLIILVGMVVAACLFSGGIGLAITLASGDFSLENSGAGLIGGAITLLSTFAGCLPFILIFGAIIGYIVYYQRARAKVGKPTVTVPTTLRVGDKFDLQYHHTFNQSITCEKFSVQLIFEERATYSQGSNTRTVTHEQVIAETGFPGRVFQAGDMIADSLSWQIPREAMHTLKAPRNVLRWVVRLKLIIPKYPDYQDEYEINVLPEIAGR